MIFHGRLRGVLCAIGLFVFIGGWADAQAVAVGKPFPDFTFKDPVKGGNHSLSDFRGKVVLIDFWATWCGPCVRELPNVQKVYRQYHDQGFEVISISLDSNRNTHLRFVKNRRMNWYHVMDGGGWKTRLAKKFRISGIPAMYLVDAQGVCISTSARGKRLATAVANALENAGTGAAAESGVRGGGEESRLGAGQRNALQVEIQDARDLLDESTSQLRTLSHRIEDLRTEAAGIAEQLPDPAVPELVSRRFSRLCQELIEVREAMFVNGLLNQMDVPLPQDVFDGGRIANRSSLALAVGQAEIAQQAGDRLHEAYAVLADEVRAVMREADKLEGDVKRGEGTAPNFRRRCDEIRAGANKVASRCTAPWQTQLRDADEMMAFLGEPLTVLEGQLGAADEMIKACRDLLWDGSGDMEDLASLEEDFGTVCDLVQQARDKAVEMGISTRNVGKTPSNPFDSLTLTDPLALARLELEIGTAARAAEQLRDAIRATKSPLDDFAARITVIQDRLDDAGEDPKQLREVQAQFSAVCRELLAWKDGH